MTVARTLLRPVEGRVTDPFGTRRDNAVGYHTGMDIAAATGTPVLAAERGVVVFTRSGSFNGDEKVGGYGNQVWIDHGEYGTVYCHLERLAVGNGRRVQRGETVGFIDNTGISTGPHLHFEVRDTFETAAGQWGNVVNPEAHFGDEVRGGDEMWIVTVKGTRKNYITNGIERRFIPTARVREELVKKGILQPQIIEISKETMDAIKLVQ